MAPRIPQRRLAFARPEAALLLAAVVAGGCGTRSSYVTIDGSSTVFPLTAIAAEDFQLATPGVQVRVGTSGTGGGFGRFCRGETDANDASRPITDDEARACAEHGIDYAPLTVALDALTVIVSAGNDWARCLTLDQLRRIWEPTSAITTWQQVDPAFPDVPLDLFGPGTDSGAFDFFTSSVVGQARASRTDYTPSEDDNVIVQAVASSPGGLGYVGYTYFEQNDQRLAAVAIDAGEGCVAPSAATAQDGRYHPLTRPLYVYASVPAMARPQVRAFLGYLVAHDASIARAAQFIPLSARQRARLIADFTALTDRAAT
ncbi:MAG: PstS family phosphate ABC transporter substrate-binding protein [Actinomycetales bacterium]|nr:PstS family phosphate ABC transporter substrate-binding protein [Actinomycetales bacterium]